MKHSMREWPRRVAVAGLIALAAIAGPAFAQTAVYNLRAAPTTQAVPDVATGVPMWGFALLSYDLGDGAGVITVNGPVTVPGPKLVVPAGLGLTVNLTNELPVAVSVIIPGQAMPVAALGAAPQVVRNSVSGRIESFVHQTAPAATGAYIWSAINPGTYLYHSGTHAAVQVQMGLYGAVTKNAVEADAVAGTPAQIYPGQAYASEALLIYSEIDPVFHAAVAAAVAAGTPPSNSISYQPKYFLVNGLPIDPVAPVADVPAGASVLVRLLNAGLKDHAPAVLGAYLTLIAEDGNPYPYAKQQYSTLLSAGKTLDALFSSAVGGSFPIFDRMAYRSRGLVQGPMHSYITVQDPPPPPAPVALVP